MAAVPWCFMGVLMDRELYQLAMSMSQSGSSFYQRPCSLSNLTNATDKNAAKAEESSAHLSQKASHCRSTVSKPTLTLLPRLQLFSR